MSLYEVNNPITEVFFERNATTGLVQGDFTIILFHDGLISAQPVTLTEVSGGYYSVAFTPNAVGTWGLDIFVTANSAVRYQKTFSVTLELAKEATVDALQTSVAALQTSVDNLENPGIVDIVDGVLEAPMASHLTPGSVGEYLNKTKKYATNRTVRLSGIYTVYDDDGVTAYETGTVTDTERKPT